MKSTLLLLLTICLSVTAYGQKTSKAKKSKNQKTEVNSADKKYTEYIKIADDKFTQKDYQSAMEHYKRALEIKPNEMYPKDQLTKTMKLLDEAQVTQNKVDDEAQYSKIIAAADKCFEGKDYLKAKEYYERAVIFKPSDPYPKAKIAEIEVILKEQKAKQEKAIQINQLIKEGDELFALKKYPEANMKYNQVLLLDATAMYPKQKITEIQNILANSYSPGAYNKVRSDSIIQIADILFAKQKYNEAKAKYYEASVYYPENKHILERVYEINSILERNGIGDAENEYSKLIAEADKKLSTKDYLNAKVMYERALERKPNEDYPKLRIAEIDKTLANHQNEYQKKMEYNTLVVQAQRQLDLKEYEKAKVSYEKAHALEPSAVLPIERIAEIEAILKENK